MKTVEVDIALQHKSGKGLLPGTKYIGTFSSQMSFIASVNRSCGARHPDTIHKAQLMPVKGDESLSRREGLRNHATTLLQEAALDNQGGHARVSDDVLVL